MASGTEGSDAAPLKVIASFYPRQYVTGQVGGDLMTVDSLRPPGIEPHDLELSGASVASLEGAAALVYLSGFPVLGPDDRARSGRAAQRPVLP